MYTLNRWKKTFVLFMSFAMILMAAVGCNQKETSEPSDDSKQVQTFGGMKITLATYWGKDLTPGQNDETDRFIQRIKDVEKKLDVDFEYIKAPTDYWSNMITTILANQPYGDIMFSFPWTFLDWVKAGAVKEVGSLDVVDFNDGTWNELIKEQATYAGRIFGFSKDNMTLNSGLLFNKRLFNEANLTSPYDLVKQGKWNFDIMQQYAKKLTKDTNGDNKIDQWGLSTMDSVWLAVCMVMSNNGQFVDITTNPPTLTFDHPKTLTGLNLYHQMVNVDKSIYARTQDSQFDDAINKFIDGKIGMFRVEEWVLQDHIKQNMKDDYGLVYFPKGPDATSYVDETFGGNIMFMPSCISDERAKAALTVYSELYDTLYPELSKDDQIRLRAQTLLTDEESVDIYMDIIKSKLYKCDNLSRVGIYSYIWDYVYSINTGKGTPKSLYETLKPELQDVVNQSVIE